MSRTFRRRDARHEYSWVLRDWDNHWLLTRRLDAHSREGRRVIARFHSDAQVTMGPAPRWYRKYFDRRIDTSNDRMLCRWFADPGFDPVFDGKHRHRANWSWW